MDTTAVRPVPWAALDQQFSTPVTDIGALLQAARLDWEPVTEIQYRKVGRKFVPVPEYKYVTHSGTGRVLDSANDGYQIFGHREMLAVAADLLSIAGGGKLDLAFVAGGPLYDGKRVWLCAKLGNELYLPGDQSAYVKHLVLANSHDGHGALKVLPVQHRILCANSVHLAEMDAKNRLAGMAAWTFKHTAGIKARVEGAKKALAATLHQLSKVDDIGKELIKIKIGKTARQEILHEHALRMVLRRDLKGIKTRDDVTASPVAMSAVNATVTELEVLLGSPTCAAISGTAWGMYQAMVEHADHMRPTYVPDRYVVRTVMARSHDKADGFAVLHELHRR